MHPGNSWYKKAIIASVLYNSYHWATARRYNLVPTEHV